MMDDGLNGHGMYNMQKDSDFINKMRSDQMMQWENKYKHDPMNSYDGMLQKNTRTQQLSFDSYTPEKFIKEISEQWNTVLKNSEKHLKEFMVKFFAYQVVEANKASTAEKAFWDW